jgi:hypothetical protein
MSTAASPNQTTVRNDLRNDDIGGKTTTFRLPHPKFQGFNHST